MQTIADKEQRIRSRWRSTFLARALSMTLAVGLLFTGTANARPAYGPASCTVNITIVSGANTMNTGQWANFRADVTVSGGTVAGYQWSVPGSILKDYQESTNSNWSTTYMMPADFRQQTIAFYWKGPYVSRQVRVVVRMSDGTTCTNSRNITVERNSVNITRQAEDFYMANHNQRVLTEHQNWHQFTNSCCPWTYNGTLFFDFHHKFLDRFNRWRAEFGYYSVPIWDPGTAIPTGVDIDHTNRGPWVYNPSANRIPASFTSTGSSVARLRSTLGCDTVGGQFRLFDYPVDRQLLGCVATSPWHNSVHGGVGGDMGNPATAPKDPLFWRWHTFINRISQARLGVGDCCSQSTDVVAPQVIDQEPFRLFHFVTDLSAISMSFHEPVTGLQAADFIVNGAPATHVSGSGAGPYRFTGFTPPALGPITVQVAPGAIHDIAGNPFTGTTWTYTLVDPAADTDSDGVTDGMEANTHLTNPTKADTDGDSLPDGYELAYPCLDPLANGVMPMDVDHVQHQAMPPQDTDGDGLSDREEFQRGSDPCAATTPAGAAGTMLGETVRGGDQPAADFIAALPLVLGLTACILVRQRVNRRAYARRVQ
ncbi:MAG: tyrosinase family protein [Chloroflexia bacterium]